MSESVTVNLKMTPEQRDLVWIEACHQRRSLGDAIETLLRRAAQDRTPEQEDDARKRAAILSKRWADRAAKRKNRANAA